MKYGVYILPFSIVVVVHFWTSSFVVRTSKIHIVQVNWKESFLPCSTTGKYISSECLSRVWIFLQLNSLQHEFLKGFLDQGQQQSFWKLSTLSNLLDLQWSLPNKWNNYSFTTVCHAYLPRWQRWPAQKPSLKNVINHLERLL